MNKGLQTRINELCRKKGITKSELAQALGVSSMDVNRIGFRDNPSDDLLLYKIADFFHVGDNFFEDEAARPVIMDNRQLAQFLDELAKSKWNSLREAETVKDYARSLQCEAELRLIRYINHIIRQGW